MATATTTERPQRFTCIRWPAQAVLTYVATYYPDHVSAADIADLLGMSRRNADPVITLSNWDADRLARHLGLHPWEIWGDWWTRSPGDT